MSKKSYKKQLLVVCVLLIGCFLVPKTTYATVPTLEISLGASDTAEAYSETLQLMFLLTIISLAPSILIMMTAFTRIIISLHFLRTALGTQTMPPNQILIGLALFLTFFIMSPVFTQINETALEPYELGQITQEEAVANGLLPIKAFMLGQARDEDISLFMDLAGEQPLVDDSNLEGEIPLHVLIPAFIISELRAGFIIGFMLYIPFIVIDMVVASTLMSMGMMMLPPAMISLPFKLLMFLLVDGWNLLVGNLVKTFM